MTDFLARLDDYAATGALPDVEWVLRAAPHKFGLGSTSHRLSGKPCVTRSLTAVCVRSYETPKRWEENRIEAERRAATYRQKWVARWGYLSWHEAYEQHLASPEWQALRHQVFDRCGGTCEHCGCRPVTQIHHIIYERLGDEMLSDLLGVCRQCHEGIHGMGDA